MFKKKPNKSSHNKRNQNTRDSIKSCKFGDSSHPEANAQLMEKFIMLAIKRTISKFAAHVLVKKRKKRKNQNGKLRVGLDP